MTGLGHDLRHGARLLVRSPGFSLAVLATIALGVGVNTAVFSVVRAVLLRQLPYHEAERLVLVEDTQPNVEEAPASYPEYVDWREGTRALDGVAAWVGNDQSLTGSGEARHLNGVRASSNLFAVLGIYLPLGRSFLREEEAPTAARVAVLGHGLWERGFGSDPAILGTSVTLNGAPFTVVGVLPGDFDTRTVFGGGVDVWIPLRVDDQLAPRGLHFLNVLARLQPGVDLGSARAEVEALAGRLRKDRGIDHGIRLEPLKERLVAGARRPLVVLLGTVAFVLLIACANVANLLLSRAFGRQREIAIRLAVGAGRARLVRQLLTESLWMGVLGGLFGLLLAWWGVQIFSHALAGAVPRAGEIRIDGTVLSFTLALSLLTALVSGLAPALHAARASLQDALKQAGPSISSGANRVRLRGLLVVSEVALALVLLVGAGLLVESFFRVLSVEKGFDPRGVLALRLDLPQSRYGSPEERIGALGQIVERMRTLPGVVTASLACHVPLAGGNTSGGFAIEGKTFPPDAAPLADKRIVGPGYFTVMRIPLLRGRFFDPRDAESGPRVAIVNETFERRFFSGQDALGKRIDFLWNTKGWQEVVGVVADVKHDALDAPSSPEIYVPISQSSRSADDIGSWILVRTTGPPGKWIGALRAQVAAVDRDAPVSVAWTMEEILSGSLAPRRLTLVLMGAFAVLALLLAAVGIHAVLSYSVAERRREIGIRLALGASPRRVLALVVGRGMRLVSVGVVLGLAAALVASRLLRGLLFGVTPTDPVAFAAVCALLLCVSLVACYFPGRRATAIDPVSMLRSE